MQESLHSKPMSTRNCIWGTSVPEPQRFKWTWDNAIDGRIDSGVALYKRCGASALWPQPYYAESFSTATLTSGNFKISKADVLRSSADEAFVLLLGKLMRTIGA